VKYNNLAQDTFRVTSEMYFQEKNKGVRFPKQAERFSTFQEAVCYLELMRILQLSPTMQTYILYNTNCLTENRFLIHYQTNMIMFFKDIIEVCFQYHVKPKNTMEK